MTPETITEQIIKEILSVYGIDSFTRDDVFQTDDWQGIGIVAKTNSVISFGANNANKVFAVSVDVIVRDIAPTLNKEQIYDILEQISNSILNSTLPTGCESWVDVCPTISNVKLFSIDAATDDTRETADNARTKFTRSFSVKISL